MSGTSRTVLAQCMKALGDAVLADIENSGPEDEDWRREQYTEGLRLQAGARTLNWVVWWERRSHVVQDANLITKLSRMQSPLDREPDLVDLLNEKLAGEKSW